MAIPASSLDSSFGVRARASVKLAFLTSNAIVLQSAMESTSMPTRVQTTFHMSEVA
ncbi:Uridylate kinase [Dorcoceras hygrometricum]|nr:Uridylate kinase [Dorcoceras hygrometricum]